MLLTLGEPNFLYKLKTPAQTCSDEVQHKRALDFPSLRKISAEPFPINLIINKHELEKDL